MAQKNLSADKLFQQGDYALALEKYGNILETYPTLVRAPKVWDLGPDRQPDVGLSKVPRNRGASPPTHERRGREGKGRGR